MLRAISQVINNNQYNQSSGHLNSNYFAAGLCATVQHPLVIWPVFSLPHWPLPWHALYQPLCKDGVGHSIKGFSEVEVDTPHCSSLIPHRATASWKAARLVEHNSASLNTGRLSLITLLFFSRLETVCRAHFTTFPMTEVKLISL